MVKGLHFDSDFLLSRLLGEQEMPFACRIRDNLFQTGFSTDMKTSAVPKTQSVLSIS